MGCDNAIDLRDDASIAEAFHGGVNHDELRRRGLRVEDVVDFSSNILPGGPSPAVSAALRRACAGSYPDHQCEKLRQSLASRYMIDAARIIVGNGCSELIHLVAATLVQPFDQVPTRERLSQLFTLMVRVRTSTSSSECRTDRR